MMVEFPASLQKIWFSRMIAPRLWYLTNQMAGTAAGIIARQITQLIFKKQDAQTQMRTKQAKSIFMGLEHGTINRSLFTHDANVYFSKQAQHDFKSTLDLSENRSAFFRCSKASAAA